MLGISLIGGAVVVGVISYFALNSGAIFDVENDFREIRTALKDFKKEVNGLTKGIENLKKYMKKDSMVVLDRYVMSIDDNFLIVKKMPKGADPHEIAKRIGGKSVYKDNILRLSFYTPGKGTDPVAVISIRPMSNITTTTKIEYSLEKSQVLDGNLLKIEWDNNKEYFDSEGLHTVRLRVMDKKFKWSEWASEDIFITEKKGIKGITGAGDHLFIVHENGAVEAYGENCSGQLGTNDVHESNKINLIKEIRRVESISTSDNHTLFLKSDKKVYGVGTNNNGQLGLGSRKDTKTPQLSWGIENVIQVECNNDISAAVTVNGEVYTWGNNENQCLGHGKKVFVDRPYKVEGVANVKQISLGVNYMLASCYDGTVMSWGDNQYGQLGLGYKSKSNEPAISTLKGIDSVVAGKNFSFAITNNNRVLALGLNKLNQLGFEGEKEALFPEEIPNLKDITKIVTIGDFTVALDLTGQVYSWGPFTPIAIKYAITPLKSETLRYIKDIAATATNGYALTEDNEVYEFTSEFNDLVKLQKSDSE